MPLRYGSLLTLAFLLLAPALSAQNAPVVEPVYGGRVHAVTAIATGTDATRVYLSTQSANSVFYTDLDFSSVTPFTAWQPLPAFDADDGYGDAIRHLAADAASGMLFLTHNTRLLAHDPTGTTVTEIEPHGVAGLLAQDGLVYYVTTGGTGGTNVHWGTVSAGTFAEDSASPLQVTVTNIPNFLHLAVHPTSGALYVYGADGTTLYFYQTSDAANALTSTTTFSAVGTPTLSGTDELTVMGIGPDGRLFLGGRTGVEPNQTKYIAYSDDDGATWTAYDTGAVGIAGSNWAFSGDASAYRAFLGSALNTAEGTSGNWLSLGWNGRETNPNDGPTVVDPNHDNVVYATTDLGIGWSRDEGDTLAEIEEGLVAVQVQGFAMSTDKTEAWVASKSGIRRVSDYAGASETWTLHYPNGDGSPYYAAAMDTADYTGDTAFVGNSRVYWTTDGGTSWERIHNEVASFSFFTRVTGIAVDPWTTGRIFVSYHDDRDGRAGLYVGDYDSGTATWTFTPITDSVLSDGADLNDVVVIEESGVPVVYAGATYENPSSGQTSRSVYRVEADGSGGWTASQDMLNSTQNISATIYDLYANTDGDLWACGTDASRTGANIYFKANGAAAWTAISASGLPSASHTDEFNCRALAVDEASGDVYIAIDEDLYVLTSGASAWALYYEYPVGTEINFLYYDDLLVGTGTGLYMHPAVSTPNEADDAVPVAYRLHAAAPHPAADYTTLRFDVREATPVRLHVYDVMGRTVAVLYDGIATAGTHRVHVGTAHLASGLYLARLVTPAGTQTQRIVVAR